MKINKAIELLILDLNNPGSVPIEDLNEAQELSIQYLKAALTFKQTSDIYPMTSLLRKDPE